MPQLPVSGNRWPRVLILVGAVLFIVALAGSAAAVPQLRLLHSLQAMIYVVIILLARRNNVAGFGAGVVVPTLWNSLQLFVTHLMQAGVRVFWSFLMTGHVRRPDTMMVALGGIAHFLLIIGCMEAFLRLHPGKKEWARFVAGGVAAVAYFALIVFFALPR